MKAAVICRFGAPRDVLRIEHDVPKPVPKRGEVLVKVRATSVNPIETRRRGGYGRVLLRTKKAVGFPMTLGLDVAGEVVTAGGRFNPGDIVFGAKDHSLNGTNAEYVAVSEAQLAAVPAKTDPAPLAALPYAFLAVWSALVGEAKLPPIGPWTKRIFIQGGSGGTGTIAIQLCKARGAYVATSCGPDAADLCKSLGADEVFDYTRDDYAKRLKDFDVALCLADLGEEDRMLSILKRNAGATFISIVHPTLKLADEKGLLFGLLAAQRIRSAAKACARVDGRNYAWAMFKSDKDALATLATMVAAGQIRPAIDRTYALDQIAEAHAYVETGRAKGKVLLTIP